MKTYDSYLQWIESQSQQMENLLIQWSNVNSGSQNTPGLIKMLQEIKNEVSSLNALTEEISLPPSNGIDGKGETIEIPRVPALSLCMRPEAPIQVLLAGHFDTVFPEYSPFQRAEKITSSRICGPGVADMKGGLIVMIKAIQALERSPYAEMIGWELFFNPDEEIGSPSTKELYRKKAHGYDIGLIFEPSFADGQLVSSRKGSATYTIITRGRSAHSGRNFHEGRNAILRMAKLVLELDEINHHHPHLIVNVGTFQGGVAANIVPDLAIVRVSCRFDLPDQQEFLNETVRALVKKHSDNEVSCSLFEGTARPPKLIDPPTELLFQNFQACAALLNTSLSWKPSGGVSDGNFLASEGLPTIDTLGVIGGNIHTYEEYVEIDSLVERAKLTALFLIQLANGEINVLKRLRKNG